MLLGLLPPRLKAVNRLTYKSSADNRCRLRLRGCPRLLEKLVARLGQSRHLYLLNIWRRGGLIPTSHLGKSVRVYRGRKWRVVNPSLWHVGFTWGALARSRKVAAFKARAANKKRKKVSKGAQLIGEMKILQFRALQLGQKRRTSTRYSTDLENQLRGLAV